MYNTSYVPVNDVENTLNQMSIGTIIIIIILYCYNSVLIIVARMFHRTAYPRRKLKSYERKKRTKHFPRVVYLYWKNGRMRARVLYLYEISSSRVLYYAIDDPNNDTNKTILRDWSIRVGTYTPSRRTSLNAVIIIVGTLGCVACYGVNRYNNTKIYNIRGGRFKSYIPSVRYNIIFVCFWRRFFFLFLLDPKCIIIISIW